MVRVGFFSFWVFFFFRFPHGLCLPFPPRHPPRLWQQLLERGMAPGWGNNAEESVQTPSSQAGEGGIPSVQALRPPSQAPAHRARDKSVIFPSLASPPAQHSGRETASGAGGMRPEAGDAPGGLKQIKTNFCHKGIFPF